jgi:hypothetical protein
MASPRINGRINGREFARCADPVLQSTFRDRSIRLCSFYARGIEHAPRYSRLQVCSLDRPSQPTHWQADSFARKWSHSCTASGRIGGSNRRPIRWSSLSMATQSILPISIKPRLERRVGSENPASCCFSMRWRPASTRRRRRLSTPFEIAYARVSSTPTPQPMAGLFAVIRGPDGYIAARLLAPKFMERMGEELGPEYFVGVPSRDLLIA